MCCAINNRDSVRHERRCRCRLRSHPRRYVCSLIPLSHTPPCLSRVFADSYPSLIPHTCHMYPSLIPLPPPSPSFQNTRHSRHGSESANARLRHTCVVCDMTADTCVVCDMTADACLMPTVTCVWVCLMSHVYCQSCVCTPCLCTTLGFSSTSKEEEKPR